MNSSQVTNETNEAKKEIETVERIDGAAVANALVKIFDSITALTLENQEMRRRIAQLEKKQRSKGFGN